MISILLCTYIYNTYLHTYIQSSLQIYEQDKNHAPNLRCKRAPRPQYNNTPALRKFLVTNSPPPSSPSSTPLPHTHGLIPILNSPNSKLENTNHHVIFSRSRTAAWLSSTSPQLWSPPYPVRRSAPAASTRLPTTSPTISVSPSFLAHIYNGVIEPNLSAITVLKVAIQDILHRPLNLLMVAATVNRQPHNMVDQAINRYINLESYVRMLQTLRKALPHRHHHRVMTMAHRLTGDLHMEDDPVSVCLKSI